MEEPRLPDAAWIRTFRRRLIPWGRTHGRHELPWRTTSDPYAVWISEVMLQQTTVAAVVPYFQRFLATLPTVEALASADEETVLRLWEGLGYYRRARQLHAAAQAIVRHHGGHIPVDEPSLTALPGIGRYTVGAIRSFAFDQKAPIVEANTERLYLRLLAERGDPTTASVKRRLWQFAESLVPERSPGAFNLALMDLGAAVCLPRTPRCPACPVQASCRTAELGLQEQIPAPKRRPVIEQVRSIAVVAQDDDGRVYLRRCGAGERFAGLWDFPRFDRLPDAPSDETSTTEVIDAFLATEVGWPRGGDIEPLGTIRHGVTRFQITLDVYLVPLETDRPRTYDRVGPLARAANRADMQAQTNADTAEWLAVADLADRPLSMTGRKIAKQLTVRGNPRETLF